MIFSNWMQTIWNLLYPGGFHFVLQLYQLNLNWKFTDIILQCIEISVLLVFSSVLSFIDCIQSDNESNESHKYESDFMKMNQCSFQGCLQCFHIEHNSSVMLIYSDLHSNKTTGNIFEIQLFMPMISQIANIYSKIIRFGCDYACSVGQQTESYKFMSCST